MIGKCKLCGHEKELCKQSHIIPNFMYKDLFDENNRMYTISGKKNVISKTGVRQTGEFEKQTGKDGKDGTLFKIIKLILRTCSMSRQAG